MSKAYVDTPEQFKEWLQERGLTDPVTNEQVKVNFDLEPFSSVIKLLVVSFNDLEAKMSEIRRQVEEMEKLIQCPECYDFKKIDDKTCEWCRKPE